MKLAIGVILLGTCVGTSAWASCAASPPQCVRARFVEALPENVKYSDRFDAECVAKLKLLSGKRRGKVVKMAVHGLPTCPKKKTVLRGSLEGMCNDALDPNLGYLDYRLKVPGEACAKKYEASR